LGFFIFYCIIILNYSLLKDGSINLKENDIFSIRKYGKYKFNKIIKNTKKDNIIIEYYKYI
jgi:RNA-binding protein YlmH